MLLGEIKRMRINIPAFAVLISLGTVDQAQQAGTSPTLPAPPASYCVFADRLFSPGAYLCVAAGTVIKCDATGKTWTSPSLGLWSAILLSTANVDRDDGTLKLAEEAERQVGRLERMHPDAAETATLRNYLDWMVGLPWTKSTKDNLDLKKAQKILDEEEKKADAEEKDN